MKLDGALKPQGAFSYIIESSIGAKNRKYRDKFCCQNYNNNNINNNNNNKSNNINNNINTSSCGIKSNNNFNKTNNSNNNSNNNNKNYKNFKNNIINNNNKNNKNINLILVDPLKSNNKYYLLQNSTINNNNINTNKTVINYNTNKINNNKNINDNLTYNKNIKGLKKSFKINKNNNNNIDKTNYCCASNDKKLVTTKQQQQQQQHQQKLPVLRSEKKLKYNRIKSNISKEESGAADHQQYLDHEEIYPNNNNIIMKMRSIQSSKTVTSYVSSKLMMKMMMMGRHKGFFNSISSLFCSFIVIFSIISIQPNNVRCDEADFFSFNSYSMSPDTSQTEFDYANRGQKYFGDKCDDTLQCGFPGSICDAKKKTCRCTEDLPITNHIDKCGRISVHNESCFFNEQCEAFSFQTECRDGRCICKFDLQPLYSNGNFECAAKEKKSRENPGIDPAMIGILCAMALMFVIICVVLRLFSQARWHENRTIFNTPNPRLMNVSLLRESKHGQERRGSRMSVRGPSRQPSMASLRPHSPNPSLASRNSNSNGSVASLRSRCDSVAAGSVKAHPPIHPHPPPHHHHHLHGNRKNSQQSNQQTPLITNVTPNPGAENITIEIIEPTTAATTPTNNHHTDI